MWKKNNTPPAEYFDWCNLSIAKCLRNENKSFLNFLYIMRCPLLLMMMASGKSFFSYI
jgi:hypothetical protein